MRAMNYTTDNGGAAASVGGSFATFTAAGANGKQVDLGTAGSISAAGTESINTLRIGLNGANAVTLAGGSTLTIATGGILMGVKIAVLLNINLAILNLLPLPVLDGGHIVFSAVEAAIRRPLNARFVQVSQTAFAALLIAFMLYVTVFSDIRRFIPEKQSTTETQPAPSAP